MVSKFEGLGWVQAPQAFLKHFLVIPFSSSLKHSETAGYKESIGGFRRGFQRLKYSGRILSNENFDVFDSPFYGAFGEFWIEGNLRALANMG